MVQTPSSMLELGTEAPDFALPEPATNQPVSLSEQEGKPLLVVFSCNHCPYVLHLIDAFVKLANAARQRGLAVVMISANDVTGYPQDGPQQMAEFARSHSFEFAYLYDESQEVARAYRATCTPDFFLFDEQHRLVYRGQFDGSRPGNSAPVDGADLRAAIDAVLSGVETSEQQIPSVGCSIKWRAGNEP